MNLLAIFGGMMPLFILGHFSHHLLTSITVPLIPFIRSAFDLDYTQSGLVISAFTLAYGIGQLPAGWLADRIEPRKLLTMGISGVALAGILVGLSQTYLLMLIFLVLMGILAGGYHPTAPPLIAASVKPEHLGRALGLHNIGGGTSHFLTPLIAVAVANAWGWRNAYIAMGIPTAVFGILFYLRLGQLNAREKANPGCKKKKEGSVDSRPERMSRIVIFLVFSTFTAAIIISVVSFIPLLLVDHFHVSKETAAALLSLIYVAVFWASPLGGYLSDRVGSVRVTFAVCFIAGPVIFLFTVLPYGLGIFALLVLVGTVIFARMSASETFIVSKAPPDRRSTILGIYFFTGMEGGGILTPVLGYAIDRLGFPTAFTIAGGAVFTVTLICAFLLWEKRNGFVKRPQARRANSKNQRSEA
ncbi:MAG: MFS transporter [Proteobacteria bacterium]|nr:MFS transporter [Pseudomonadota bacterium]